MKLFFKGFSVLLLIEFAIVLSVIGFLFMDYLSFVLSIIVTITFCYCGNDFLKEIKSVWDY